MERYSLIVVADETAPIRRFDVLKSVVHRGLWGLGLLAVVATVGMVDYVTLRVERPEFLALKAEAAEQRNRIAQFEQTLEDVTAQLAQVKEFERKIRIIANVPGAAGTGGDDIAEVSPGAVGDLEAAGGGQGGEDPETGLSAGAHGPGSNARETLPADASRGERVSALRTEAERLGLVAEARSLSLKELVDQLEDKQRFLASSPAI